MIYLIGGAPRTGKSNLAQQFAAKHQIGWISTDLLMEILRAKEVQGIKTAWNATPEAIAINAEWFYPCLQRFVAAVSSSAGGYVIEGVDFLPAQIAQLSQNHQIRSVFLGCSKMDLTRFDRYPGRSPGYARLPQDVRRQISDDIPRWSQYIRHEAQRFGLPYVDMIDDFSARLREANALLTTAQVT